MNTKRTKEAEKKKSKIKKKKKFNRHTLSWAIDYSLLTRALAAKRKTARSTHRERRWDNEGLA